MENGKWKMLLPIYGEKSAFGGENGKAFNHSPQAGQASIHSSTYLNAKKVLSGYAGKTLMLRQPAVFKSRYELFFEDEIIGTIEKPRLFSFNAIAEIFKTKWEIKRENIWKGNLGIYQYGYEMPLAVYTQKIFGKGLLKLEKGIILYFDYKMWKGITEIKTESGKILISSKSKSGWKIKSIISILQKSELLDSKPWLIMLLSYIAIARQRSNHAG